MANTKKTQPAKNMVALDAIINSFADISTNVYVPKTEAEKTVMAEKRQYRLDHTCVYEVRKVNGLRTFIRVYEVSADEKNTTNRVFKISSFSWNNDGTKVNKTFVSLPALTVNSKGIFQPCKANGETSNVVTTQDKYNTAVAIVTKAALVGFGVNDSKVQALDLTLTPAPKTLQ